MMGMMLWMFVFWALIIGGGVWLLVSWRGRAGDGDAFELLRSRLARGEIDVQEFETREEALRQSQRQSLRRPAIAVVIAIVLLIAIPSAIMAASGWNMEMWDMHGQGRNTSGDPVVRGGAETAVRIEGFAFDPGNLEVPVGAVITWTNVDSAPHDATARDRSWATDRLTKGDSDQLTFDSPGTYDYYCTIHPSMKAKLIVR